MFYHLLARAFCPASTIWKHTPYCSYPDLFLSGQESSSRSSTLSLTQMKKPDQEWQDKLQKEWWLLQLTERSGEDKRGVGGGWDEKGCMSSEGVESVTENRRELPICSRINITVQCLLFLTKNWQVLHPCFFLHPLPPNTMCFTLLILYFNKISKERKKLEAQVQISEAHAAEFLFGR